MSTAKKNRNYVNGAALERKVKAYFEQSGFLASRSAGSHGPFDVQADDGITLWYIQCKARSSDKTANMLVDSLVEMVQKMFPKVGHPIAVMVCTGIRDGRPHGVARLLVPGEEGVIENASHSEKEDGLRQVKGVR